MNFSIFEALMLICFGLSWPISLYRSFKARSAKGKSVVFLLLLFTAYVCGVLHKSLVRFDLVIVLYAINLAMVTADILLYIRNARLDKTTPPNHSSSQIPKQAGASLQKKL